MNICLLTYDAPHLKTSQVLMGMLSRRMKSIDFLLMPFVNRTPREVLFQHRPNQFVGPDPTGLARLNGGKTYPYSKWRDLVEHYDYFLICGSNLIEPEFALSGKILNVHAGLIPAVRGLDSLKWAILDMQPVGNTLHLVDERADAGKVLYRRNTPIFLKDDLSSFAQRHYESEIDMLINFDRWIDGHPPDDLEERDPTMRMPLHREAEMVKVFEAYKTRFAVDA